MDASIIAWVIEFLIRSRAPPPLINAFLTDHRFPVRDINNPRLKKTICLRNIQDQISNGPVSLESVLDSLETIEGFDQQDENLTTHSMKQAYCAVAVECTVKYLREEDGGKFFDAVKRIWRERVENLEVSRNSELITNELKELKEEMEAALWNPQACERLLVKVGETEAVKLVNDYLKEAFAIMGPSFVDLAARAEVEINMRREREAAKQDHDEVKMEEANQSNGDQVMLVTDRPARQDGNRVETEEASEADVSPDIIVLDRSANAEVGQIPHIDVNEVIKVRDALHRSCMELRSLVNDPLPEAIRISDALRAKRRETSLNKETSVKKQNGNDTDTLCPPINAKVSRETTETLNPVPLQVIQNMNTNAEIPLLIHQVVTPKCSLMERNTTACTFELNESIDGTSQEAANSMVKDKLPTESQRRTLPSLEVKTVVGNGRKRPKKWSLEEEDGLREGVKRFGVGNWALILKSKHDLFVDRRAVDLKDKWRNMTKSSEGQRT